MKTNKFKYVAVLGLAVLLSSCGGGGSSTVNDGGGNPPVENENGDNLNEVLPFGLNRSDANVAARIAVWARIAPQIALSVKRQGVERSEEDYDGSQDDSSDPILTEFIYPECSSGSINIVDNKPDFFRASDLKGVPSWRITSMSELVAKNCHIKDDYTFVNGYARSKAEHGNTDTYTREYSNFTYDNYGKGGLDENKIEERSVAITGSSVYVDTHMNKEDGKLNVSIPNDVYMHGLGDKLELDDFIYAAVKASGVTRVESFAYNARWDVANIETGGQFLKHGISTIVGVDPRKEYLAVGAYDLSLVVTSPLVYQPSGGSGLIHGISSGSVTLNLVSHDIQATIVYHSGYADVVFNRRGKVEQFRLDLE